MWFSSCGDYAIDLSRVVLCIWQQDDESLEHVLEVWVDGAGDDPVELDVRAGNELIEALRGD